MHCNQTATSYKCIVSCSCVGFTVRLNESADQLHRGGTISSSRRWTINSTICTCSRPPTFSRRQYCGSWPHPPSSDRILLDTAAPRATAKQNRCWASTKVSYSNNEDIDRMEDAPVMPPPTKKGDKNASTTTEQDDSETDDVLKDFLYINIENNNYI